MKHLLLVLTLLTAPLVSQANAINALPFLGALRAEVVNQQVIASNNIAITNDVAGNKKLLVSFKKALVTIDKTKTNYVAGSASLGALAKNLNRTSVSNVFAPIFQDTVDDYVSALEDVEGDLQDRLDPTFPGKAHDAAAASLLKLLAALDGAHTNANVVLAAKFLGIAAKGVVAADKAVQKAQAQPAPANSFTATVSASNQGTFTYKPIIQSVQAAYVPSTHLLNIVSTEIKASGTTINTLDAQVKNIGIVVVVPSDGSTHTYNLSTNSDLIYYSFSHTHGGAKVFGEVYAADSGTLTLTFDSANHLVYGTFNFAGNGQDNSALSANVNGSFSIHYLQ